MTKPYVQIPNSSDQPQSSNQIDWANAMIVTPPPPNPKRWRRNTIMPGLLLLAYHLLVTLPLMTDLWHIYFWNSLLLAVPLLCLTVITFVFAFYGLRWAWYRASQLTPKRSYLVPTIGIGMMLIVAMWLHSMVIVGSWQHAASASTEAHQYHLSCHILGFVLAASEEYDDVCRIYECDSTTGTVCSIWRQTGTLPLDHMEIEDGHVYVWGVKWGVPQFAFRLDDD